MARLPHIWIITGVKRLPENSKESVKSTPPMNCMKREKEINPWESVNNDATNKTEKIRFNLVLSELYKRPTNIKSSATGPIKHPII